MSSTTTSSFADRPAFVPTKLRLREDQITSDGGKCFGVGLSGLLEKAYTVAGIEAPKPPTETRECKRSLDQNAIQWSHPLFGNLQVEMGGQLKMGEVVAKGPNMCSQLYVFTKPQFIWLNLAVFTNLGVRVLHAKAGQVTEVLMGGVPTLRVPVRWNHEGLPHTRERDMDNVDLVFLNPQGMFVQLQVSLVTRKKRFWVQIQEIYSGQVVRTNHAKAKELNVTTHHVGSHAGLIVPLYAENAYAGADYIKSNPRMAGPVIEHAIKWGAVVPMGDAVVAKWQPERAVLLSGIANKGFVPAVVQWFNLVLGQGFAVLPNGQSCYMHFDNIVDARGNKVAEGGENPMLQPMRAVAVKYHQQADKPNPKATAIMVL